MSLPASIDWLLQPCAQWDSADETHARQRQSQLTKPPGSLGMLEDVAVRLASLQRLAAPRVDTVWISVFAADHGVAKEGISAFPQVVTGEMVRNFANGGAAISVMARELGATLEVVQLGTVNDPGEMTSVRRAWIAPATANFCKQAAMDDEQLAQALVAGRQSVQAALSSGAQLFIGGEMGIGNTTSATALSCALLGIGPDALTGAGTGLDAAGIHHKAAVIARALALHAKASTPLEILRALGGFEIAALTGAYIACAQSGLPVLVDGFISSAAALAAVRLQPGVQPWLLFAHQSHERGHRLLLEALGARPLLALDMRLGEASGAAMAVPLLRMACALHNTMATFEQAGVSDH